MSAAARHAEVAEPTVEEATQLVLGDDHFLHVKCYTDDLEDDPLYVHAVRKVVTAERPLEVIPEVHVDPSLAMLTAGRVDACLDQMTAFDPRDRFEPCTPDAISRRDRVNEVIFRPTQPLAMINVKPCSPCFFRGMYVVDIPLDHVGPGSVRHCLKGTYRPVRDGMPVLLEWKNHAWGLGVLFDTALRRSNVLCQAVAIINTIEFTPDGRHLINLTRVPRWGNGVVPYEADALVPNLAYALQRTPDDPALLPFQILSTTVQGIPDFADRVRLGTDFTIQFN